MNNEYKLTPEVLQLIAQMAKFLPQIENKTAVYQSVLGSQVIDSYKAEHKLQHISNTDPKFPKCNGVNVKPNKRYIVHLGLQRVNHGVELRKAYLHGGTPECEKYAQAVKDKHLALVNNKLELDKIDLGTKL